jgi:hypothetical protein
LKIGPQPPGAGAAAGVSDPLVDFDSVAPEAAPASGVAADEASVVAADPAAGVAALADVVPPPVDDPPPVIAVKPSARAETVDSGVLACPVVETALAEGALPAEKPAAGRSGRRTSM